jgi:hypothetical protein
MEADAADAPECLNPMAVVRLIYKRLDIQKSREIRAMHVRTTTAAIIWFVVGAVAVRLGAFRGRIVVLNKSFLLRWVPPQAEEGLLRNLYV